MVSLSATPSAMHVTRAFVAALLVAASSACPAPSGDDVPPPPCPTTTARISVAGIDVSGEVVVAGALRDDDVVTLDIEAVDGPAAGTRGTLTFSVLDEPLLPALGASLSMTVGTLQLAGEGEGPPAYWRFTDERGELVVEGGDAGAAIDDTSAAAPLVFVGAGAAVACSEGPARRGAFDVGFRGDEGDVFLGTDERAVIEVGGVPQLAVSLGGLERTEVIPENCGDCPPPGELVVRSAAGYAYRRAPVDDPEVRVGDVTVRSQGDVDALAGVRFIRAGGLHIVATSDLDLTPLASLEEIDASLIVAGDDGTAHISSLAGLERLRRVAAAAADFAVIDLAVRAVDVAPLGGVIADVSSLRVRASPRLADLAPLSGVTWRESLSIEDNAALTSFAGPTPAPDASLPFVTVRDNAALTSLDGLAQLVNADVIDVTRCPALVDLGGLVALTSVERVLAFLDVGAASLAGLTALDSVGSLFVGGPSLTSLEGLPSSFSLGQLRVEGAPALTSLEGVGGALGLHTLALVDVPALTSIAVVPALAPPGGGPGALEVTRTGLVAVDGLAEQVALAPLIVRENPALVDLGLPALQSAGLLNVTLNAALSQADAEAFAARVGDVVGKVVGNAGDDAALPLDACPFEDDLQCDEPGLCASDLCDCHPDSCGAD